VESRGLTLLSGVFSAACVAGVRLRKTTDKQMIIDVFISFLSIPPYYVCIPVIGAGGAVFTEAV
jgi:hypothetical protein